MYSSSQQAPLFDVQYNLSCHSDTSQPGYDSNCYKFYFVGLQNKESTQMKITSNPSAGNFNLQDLDANISYNIIVYDLSGKQVYKNKVNGKAEFAVDISYL